MDFPAKSETPLRLAAAFSIRGADPMQMGRAAAAGHRPEEAAAWFARAADAAPADPEASAWLGQALCHLGRRREGVARLRQAAEGFLAAAGGVPDLDRAMAVIGQLQQWGDMEGALAPCRRLAEAAPDDPRAQRLLAATCGQLNLLPEALLAGERALELDPDDPMLAVQQASLEADAGFLERARRRLEKAFDRGLPDREAFRAHKELARICDALGEADPVFPHIEAAAGIAPRLPEFLAQDPRIVPQMVAEAAEGFDDALLARTTRADMAGEGPAPAFVIGFYRSGTTLAQRVLATHPAVFVADEAGLIGEVRDELHRLQPGAGSVPDKLRRTSLEGLKALRRFYWDRARARYGGDIDRGLFVDKFTMNTIDAGLINAIFPDARLVFLTRDPRDVVLSCVLQLMTPTPATVHLLTWRGAAAFYGAVMDGWLDVRDRLTAAVTDVRYEDAVVDFEGTFRRLFAFLGLAWTPEALTFHIHAAGRFVASPSRNQVARPLYDSSVGRWRRYAARYAEIEDLIGPFVDELGYAA